MSRVLAVVGVVLVAIVLLASSSSADSAKSLVARVAELETTVSDQAYDIADLLDTVGDQADAIADLEDEVSDLASHAHDSDYVLAPGEDLAVVRGTVGFNGSIFDGDGFTVTRKGEGWYYVSYDFGTFSDAPVVLVQALGTDVTISYVDSGTYIGFNVKTTDGGSQSFKFIAIGPQ